MNPSGKIKYVNIFVRVCVSQTMGVLIAGTRGLCALLFTLCCFSILSWFSAPAPPLSPSFASSLCTQSNKVAAACFINQVGRNSTR